MEGYSINSSIKKSVASEGTATRTIKAMDSAEESGWTAYFEDLSTNDHHDYGSSFSCSSSLISDASTTAAAAAAAWKISHNNHHVFACSSTPSPKNIPKKLKLKKTRTKEIFTQDDSLEDTASSPVNNPKVGDWKSADHLNPRKKEDEVHCSLGKETASENYSEIQIEEENKMKFDQGMENDCTELKKKGLRLVPLSMLVNYLG